MSPEVKILKAISETMTCDKCPYPCESEQKYGMSSQANCVNHWSLILSQIDTKNDWSEACSEIAFLMMRDMKAKGDLQTPCHPYCYCKGDDE